MSKIETTGDINDFVKTREFWEAQGLKKKSSTMSDQSNDINIESIETDTKVIETTQNQASAPKEKVEEIKPRDVSSAYTAQAFFLDDESDSEDKKQHTFPNEPVVIEMAANAMSNMFKSWSEFSNSLGNSAASSTTSNKNAKANLLASWSSSPTDMSNWRSKMIVSSSKMNQSFSSFSSSLKTTINNTTAQMIETHALASSGGPGGVISNKPKVYGQKKFLNLQWPSPKSEVISDDTDYTVIQQPYGELLVAEILAARDLPIGEVGELLQAQRSPYVIVKQLVKNGGAYTDLDWIISQEQRTIVVEGSNNPVFNERFVFYLPPPPEKSEITIASHRLVITVMDRRRLVSDEHIGEVTLCLEIPLSTTYDRWFPLIRMDGRKQGAIRLGVRRMPLLNTQVLIAAQALAGNERALNEEDVQKFGSLLPELWYNFSESAEPMPPVMDERTRLAKEKLNQTTEVLADKFKELNKWWTGTDAHGRPLPENHVQRDVF